MQQCFLLLLERLLLQGYRVVVEKKVQTFETMLNKEHFRMIIDHLDKRGRDIDLLTIQNMKQFYFGHL